MLLFFLHISSSGSGSEKYHPSEMKDGLEHGPPTPPHYKAEKRSALGGINKVPSLKSFMGDLFASALYLGVEGGPVEKYIY